MIIYTDDIGMDSWIKDDGRREDEDSLRQYSLFETLQCGGGGYKDYGSSSLANAIKIVNNIVLELTHFDLDKNKYYNLNGCL